MKFFVGLFVIGCSASFASAAVVFESGSIDELNINNPGSNYPGSNYLGLNYPGGVYIDEGFFGYPLAGQTVGGAYLPGSINVITNNANNELGNALIELKALIKEEEYYASSSDQLVNLSNLATLLSELENEASLNDEAGFLGTFSSANQVIQNLQYDTDNNYYAENIQLILQENQAAYNQLANGQATLNDITPKIEADLNLLVNALKAAYGNSF